MVGIAQEKTSAWRGWRDGGPDGHPHFVYRRQSIFPNNYYFYIRDPDWGPTFIKTVAYAPFPVWIYLNGNEWAKQQAAQQSIAFAAWITGSRRARTRRRSPRSATACPPRMSALFFDRWQARAALAPDRRGPPTRVRACARVPATGDLRHPRVRPAGRRARLVRGNAPRSAHARSPRSGRGHLRPARQPPDPGPVPHQDLQPRGRGGDPDPLPRLEGQAVLQRRPRAHGPRRPSTTPATSVSAGSSPTRTGTR